MNWFAANVSCVFGATFESGGIAEISIVTGLPFVSTKPRLVRILSDDSSCRICNTRLSDKPTDPAGVTAGMNWPYVPFEVWLYVRAVTVSFELDGVVTSSEPRELVSAK